MKQLVDTLAEYARLLTADKAAAIDPAVIDKLYSVYPFNKFEYIISHLIAERAMSLDDYLELRTNYIERNRYLYLFEIAPRTFGETWGERHMMELVPEFEIPRRNKDPMYAGEYDLWLEGVKVEVKASRVVRKSGGGTLAEKALPWGTKENFDMNFQQLKPSCCDVFVWIAVWRDRIDYWVLPSSAVSNHPLFSNQHRASAESADEGIFEGQIHINRANYTDFEAFKVNPRDIFDKIKTLRANHEI